MDFNKIDYLHRRLEFKATKDTLAKFETLALKSGITVTQNKPKIILQAAALQQLLSQNSLLISISRPILNKTFYSFYDKKNILFLTDNNGYIIDLISSPEIILSCFNKGIMLGSNMSYSSFGTTSISLAMHEHCPMALLAQEHYCDILKRLNCLAAPIKLNNKIIGYLAASVLEPPDLLPISNIVFLLIDLIETHMHYHLEKEQNFFHPNKLQNETNHPSEYKINFYGTMMLQNKLVFTTREIEILYLLHRKQHYDVITEQLCISKNTLKTHIRNIYHKLEVTNLNDCLSKINTFLKIKN